MRRDAAMHARVAPPSDSTWEKLAAHCVVLCNDDAATWERGKVRVDIKIKRASMGPRPKGAVGWRRKRRRRRRRRTCIDQGSSHTQCHSSGNLSEMGHYELKAASSRFSITILAERHEGKRAGGERWRLGRKDGSASRASATRHLSRKRDRLTSS